MFVLSCQYCDAIFQRKVSPKLRTDPLPEVDREGWHEAKQVATVRFVDWFSEQQREQRTKERRKQMKRKVTQIGLSLLTAVAALYGVTTKVQGPSPGW